MKTKYVKNCILCFFKLFLDVMLQEKKD
uniref:Uncharacterized protein n=1 Tax=Anguilla anguilla TaxID=7936 RepID=A0A0E9SKJ9_ANGAN